MRRQVLSDTVTADISPAKPSMLTMGPSGSGKTTLLTLVGALRSPCRRSVRVLDRELRGASARERRAMRLGDRVRVPGGTTCSAR